MAMAPPAAPATIPAAYLRSRMGVRSCNAYATLGVRAASRRGRSPTANENGRRLPGSRRPQIGLMRAFVSRSFHGEWNDDVAAECELRTLSAGGKGRLAVQRRVVANLGSHDDLLDTERIYWNRRRDGEADREGAIGGSPAAVASVWQAELEIDEVEVARKRGNEEAVVVAPNLAAPSDLEPVIDRVDDVLRHAVAVRPEAIIADVVQVGDEGELVVHLPCCCDVIEVAESAVGIAPTRNSSAQRVRIFRTDMGGRQDRERAIQEIVQADTAVERHSLVVVPVVPGGQAVVAECRIHARVDTGIDIDRLIHVCSRHYPSVLERDAEIENVGMRVKRIIRRIDDLRAFQGDVMTEFHIDTARGQPRQVGEPMGLDDVELVYAVDRICELAQKLCGARIRSVHRLNLEAEIVTRRLRIERTLYGQHRLIQHEPVRFIGEQMAKIDTVGWIDRIEGEAR